MQPSKVGLSSILFEAQSEEASRWSSCRINFIASTRTDIELGSVTLRSPAVNPNDNTFNMIYSLKNDLPVAGLKIKSFLQGVNLYSESKDKIGIKE